MDEIFFAGIVIGTLTRLIMLNLDKKQYPTQPNILIAQIVLAVVASALGALLVPALIERSYTSITFLSLAAEEFREVRENRRNSLEDLEDEQLVKRGNAFIEDIAKTYEVRNYMCIVTSFLTVGAYYIIIAEFKLDENPAVIICSIGGIILAFILKKLIERGKIGDIADVRVVDISFEEGGILKVGGLSGITNIGLKEDRERFLQKAVGIEVLPKDNSYINASIIQDMGQRQAIMYNLYNSLGVYMEFNEPAFYPLPRRYAKNESIVFAYIPINKDIEAVIDAVKSCPILASARGKNLGLKNYKITKDGGL